MSPSHPIFFDFALFKGLYILPLVRFKIQSIVPLDPWAMPSDDTMS
ncbi:MAG: hypothetical protein OXC92_03440 [Flavobacteriaceae bacterium]|nr:hypothetical protein [Flavobacteriaceae bacterium]